jgi:hypothetical protein
MRRSTTPRFPATLPPSAAPGSEAFLGERPLLAATGSTRNLGIDIAAETCIVIL